MLLSDAVIVVCSTGFGIAYAGVLVAAAARTFSSQLLWVATALTALCLLIDVSVILNTGLSKDPIVLSASALFLVAFQGILFLRLIGRIKSEKRVNRAIVANISIFCVFVVGVASACIVSYLKERFVRTLLTRDGESYSFGFLLSDPSANCANGNIVSLDRSAPLLGASGTQLIINASGEFLVVGQVTYGSEVGDRAPFKVVGVWPCSASLVSGHIRYLGSSVPPQFSAPGTVLWVTTNDAWTKWLAGLGPL